MHRLLARGGDCAEERAAIEDPLEEIRLPPGGLELRFAVSARQSLELDAAGPNTAGQVRHELAVAAIEPVGDPNNGGQLLDDRLGVRVQALPVFVRLSRALALVVAGD